MTFLAPSTAEPGVSLLSEIMCGSGVHRGASFPQGGKRAIRDNGSLALITSAPSGSLAVPAVNGARAAESHGMMTDVDNPYRQRTGREIEQDVIALLAGAFGT
jgi:hypothetical protein